VPDGTVGVAYSQSLPAAGGNGALIWNIATGALPAGLMLSSNGLISGTPTVYGKSTITFRVADSDAMTGPADEATKTLTVNTLPANISASSSPLVLVVIGASTAACKNLDQDKDLTGATFNHLAACWVTRFSSYLQIIRPGTIVYNIADAGTGSCGALPTNLIIPAACNNAGSKAAGHPIPDVNYNITMALSYSPNAIIVHYPHDDKIGVDNTIINFHTLQDAATAVGVPIWIATSQPATHTDVLVDATLIPSRLDQLAKVQSHFGFRSIDIWTPLADGNNEMPAIYENQYDNKHPNAEGHRVLYETIKAAMAL